MYLARELSGLHFLETIGKCLSWLELRAPSFSRGVASDACGQSPCEQLWPGKLASNEHFETPKNPDPFYKGWRLQHNPNFCKLFVVRGVVLVHQITDSAEDTKRPQPI